MVDTNIEHRNLIIIGSGCAGLTSAIYSARADLSPLVIGGINAGGQLTKTTDVENFPGFPEGIMGPELVDNMRKQAERFGAKIINTNVSKIDLSSKPFSLTAGEINYTCDAIVVATGADARMLGLPNEERLIGHGVSTCATCDGFFYRGKEVAIVGGGDSALEESMFLTKFASKVSVIHRRDSLRASKIMQEKAFANKKIEFVWDSVIVDVLDEETGAVTGILVKNVKTDVESTIKVDGLFVAIGHIPNTKFFDGQLKLDENGYILTTSPDTQTSVEGVFAAGDVFDKRYQQAITASAMGCKAALDAEKYLDK